MDVLLFFVSFLSGLAAAFCLLIALPSTLIVSIGIARDEGKKRLALGFLICWLFLFPLGQLACTVFLFRKRRYRQALWIWKFLLGGLVALIITSVLAMTGEFNGNKLNKPHAQEAA